MSFGKLQGLGQQYVQRLGGLDPMNQETATDEQKEAAKLAGRRELFARLSDAFAGREIQEGSRQRQLAAQQAELNKLQKQKLLSPAQRKIVEGADGRKYYEDTKELVLPGIEVPEKDQRTSEIKGYEYAVQNDGFTGTFQDWVNIKTPKGDTINVGNSLEGIRYKELLDLGSKDIEENKKRNATGREVIPKLETAQRILNDPDFDTGPISEATLPFRRLYSDITGIGDENLSNEEYLDALSSYVTPRMRPPGSGATSDFEAQLFQDANFSLGKTKEANRLIVGTFLQQQKRDEKLLGLKEDYFLQFNTTIGFDKYVQENDLMPKLYQEVRSTEGVENLIKNREIKEGDVYIDYITDPNNPVLRIFTKRDFQN
jgi:hypothetical protein